MHGLSINARLKRLHRMLVISRYTLEWLSAKAGQPWLGDLLFMISCRRALMLSVLDRQLGSLALSLPSEGHMARQFDTLLADYRSGMPSTGPRQCVRACEEEEAFLEQELASMEREPGLESGTREVVSQLLNETRGTRKELRFLRANHTALKG